MGRKSRKKMTGFTAQGRHERSIKRKEEEEKAKRRVHRAMIRGLLAMKKETNNG